MKQDMMWDTCLLCLKLRSTGGVRFLLDLYNSFVLNVNVFACDQIGTVISNDIWNKSGTFIRLFQGRNCNMI